MYQETNEFLSNQELYAHRSSANMSMVICLVKLSVFQNEAKKHKFGKWTFKEDLNVDGVRGKQSIVGLWVI